MISKERILIELNTTTRLPPWGETAIRLVVLFVIVLFMCYSKAGNEYIIEKFYCQVILRNLTIY